MLENEFNYQPNLNRFIFFKEENCNVEFEYEKLRSKISFFFLFIKLFLFNHNVKNTCY
jgi:hypothetical protein